jgi:hypothetical protein
MNIDILLGAVPTGSPRYSPSRRNAATQGYMRSAAISSGQQETLLFQIERCHHSGDARMKAECLKLGKMMKFRGIKMGAGDSRFGPWRKIFLVSNKFLNGQTGIIPFIWR